MAQHPARGAQLLALAGAALLIITFGTLAMQLGNEMARHGRLDSKSAWSEQYLRQMQKDVSDSRICYYAWRATHEAEQQSCFSSGILSLATLSRDYTVFEDIQERLGQNRPESLQHVLTSLKEITSWHGAPEAALERADTDRVLAALSTTLATLTRADNAGRAGRLADLLRNTDWQKRLDIIGIVIGVLIMGAAGWLLDRASLAAARAEAGSSHLALQLRAVLDSLPVGVAVFTTDGRLRHHNDRFGDILGLTPETMTQDLSYSELSDHLGRSGLPVLESFSRISERLQREGGSSAPVSVECKGINGADLELTCTPFEAPDAPVSDVDRRGFIITVSDISMRLRSERALGEAQKLRAVGQLTAGIAHDFKNLLTIILGNLDLASDCVTNDMADRRQESLDAAAHAARGAEALTGQILSFMRRETPSREVVSVSDVLVLMRGLLARVIGTRMRVECDNSKRVWPVSVNAAQLESAILNLAINARDAMPEGGTIRICAYNNTFLTDTDLMVLPVEDGRVMRVLSDPTPIQAGAWVRIDVTDSGSGMTRQVMDRLFQPFFTTKGDDGRGTGLGMSMVVTFARQSGGRVAVISAPGRGTRVSLWLPSAGESGEVEIPPAPEENTVQAEDAPLRVLVVEDDPAIRDIVVTILGMSGYAVTEAGDGDAALDLVSAPGQVPDILVTDVQIPGALNGFQLARVLRERFPRLGVVCMSGEFVSGDGSRPADAPEYAQLLPKPFRRDALAETVRRATEARPVA
ncbi:response regulator [Acetobacter sp. AN02]|uniref:ATP-binding protein n=1 Tax=Acetobacter sp. AN02 TaxID=2894186 RepID=UPI0024346879|nr:ATP-binding protein [Acetobacter sp. AN02]MDG6095210.1 response regulator [Acetobacter sp. AN02]